MGQKTDARIFRLGVIKKNWELKYIEKNLEESSLYLYEILEIQKYLNRFFGLYKIKIHNCKICYSDSCLHLFISFYITAKTIQIIHKMRKRKKLITIKKKPTKTIKRLKNQKIKKQNLLKFNCNTKRTNIVCDFQEILLESLTNYTQKKINIFVIFQNLNNHKHLSSYTQIKDFKNVFKQLQKFSKNDFFKAAINILFISITKRKSAKILADFLSDQFKLNQLRTDSTAISRKDNRFLGFLKQAVQILIKSKISCLTGIKIVISGRFNKAPRAKSVIIQFGTSPLQSFSSYIDYFQSTAYTINGTFGIKVWTCEK